MVFSTLTGNWTSVAEFVSHIDYYYTKDPKVYIRTGTKSYIVENLMLRKMQHFIDPYINTITSFFCRGLSHVLRLAKFKERLISTTSSEVNGSFFIKTYNTIYVFWTSCDKKSHALWKINDLLMTENFSWLIEWSETTNPENRRPTIRRAWYECFNLK